MIRRRLSTRAPQDTGGACRPHPRRRPASRLLASSRSGRAQRTSLPQRTSRLRLATHAAHLTGTVRRILTTAALLLAITFVTFVLMRLAGGDVVTARMEARQVLSAELADSQRHALGLDRPLLVQYLSWLTGLASLGGNSMVTGEPVFPLFAARLPATAALMALSLLMTLMVSVPLGALAAVRPGGWVDRVAGVGALIGNALPGFLLALLLTDLLAVRAGWLPVVSSGAGGRGIILPALTLTVAMSAKYVRQVRSALAQELAEPYAQAALERGLSAPRLVALALPATVPTLITLVALSAGSLLGGTAIIESVFMWDGVGRMAVDAIGMRDYPVLLTYVMWMAIAYVLLAAAADALAARVDPRRRPA